MRLQHAGPGRSRMFIFGGCLANGFREASPAPADRRVLTLCHCGRGAPYLKLKEADPLHQVRPVVLYVADLCADLPRLDLASVRLHIRSSRFPPIAK
jgi:hypothetical protein